MDIARASATGMTIAALAIGIAITGCSKGDDSTSESASSSVGSSTSSADAGPSETTAAETTAAEETSAPAEPSDYGSLLLPPSDMGSSIETPGGIQLNPGGNPGAAQVYQSADSDQRIIDTILVFPDVAAAGSNFESNSATLNSVVTGAPTPIEVGDQGVMAAGTSPDGAREVTVILFTQGKALVSLNFESAPGDPVPAEIATEIANMQAAAIKGGLPEE
ncbi:hypothetical protein [Mycolicibacterium iranicum]|uniref:Uncharacterized protein n=1 Tax=Mycolicibacterium iranicum TaxID=912594 RepID=A0A178LRL7_MYCIR|nr:hypothetical protein [Mycolicibacterium iranicum]OAN35767.1 hypothetical protein A4X20_25970 [Mycolicibacterium iranicum]